MATQQGRYRLLRARLVQLGWREEKRGGHYMLYPPDPKIPGISISCSPDPGGKTHMWLRGKLRKAGFEERW